jgi:hypothetical protein
MSFSTYFSSGATRMGLEESIGFMEDDAGSFSEDCILALLLFWRLQESKAGAQVMLHERGHACRCIANCLFLRLSLKSLSKYC